MNEFLEFMVSQMNFRISGFLSMNSRSFGFHHKKFILQNLDMQKFTNETPKCKKFIYKAQKYENSFVKPQKTKNSLTSKCENSLTLKCENSCAKMNISSFWFC